MPAASKAQRRQPGCRKRRRRSTVKSRRPLQNRPAALPAAAWQRLQLQHPEHQMRCVVNILKPLQILSHMTCYRQVLAPEYVPIIRIGASVETERDREGDLEG